MGAIVLKILPFFCDTHIYDPIGQFKTTESLVIVISMVATDWLAQGLLQVVFAFGVKLVHPGT